LQKYRVDNADHRDKPLVLVPDLAVEVISPKDSYSKVNEKIETYLSDGVRLLWIVDPQRKTIAIYEGSDTPKTLREGDTLSGGHVLPEFTLSVNEVFG
jgi:Uma2 family endonuclease